MISFMKLLRPGLFLFNSHVKSSPYLLDAEWAPEPIWYWQRRGKAASAGKSNLDSQL
jgi:hypothetical protein